MAQTEDTKHTAISSPRSAGATILSVVALAAAATLSACDDGTANGSLAQASNQLRIAPAKGLDEDGTDLSAAAYAQAASTAQGSPDAAASLIAADAIAAQAQASFKTATDAWFGITAETASGNALIIRLAGEQARLATLQTFDPGPTRASISARRTELQQALRNAETQLDEINAEIAAVEQQINQARANARNERDAAEALRERATNIGGTQRAELIEQANRRQRGADAFEQQAAETTLQRERAEFRNERSQQQIDSLRRQLEALMQRERALEADVANRSQQAATARDNINQLNTRIAGQINTMAERYNNDIAPAFDEAISGFESSASRARQAQAIVGNTARLSIGASEHALASTHRAHAVMLGSMLSFVDLAVARGVTAATLTDLRRELDAKRAEAEAAAQQAADQASASLSGAGASGRAGEILNEVAEMLRGPGAGGNDLTNPDENPDQDWQEEPESNDDFDAE